MFSLTSSRAAFVQLTLTFVLSVGASKKEISLQEKIINNSIHDKPYMIINTVRSQYTVSQLVKITYIL